MRSQLHVSRSGVRSSTNVGFANKNGSSDCRTFGTTQRVLGSVVSTLLFFGGCRNKNVSAAAAPPPNVQIVEVMQGDVPVYHEYLATLDGYVNAQIQPQVSGYLIKQNYLEGAVVGKNQVLFKIDPGLSKRSWIKPRRRSHKPRRSLGRRSWTCNATLPWQKKKQSRRVNSTTILKPI